MNSQQVYFKKVFNLYRLWEFESGVSNVIPPLGSYKGMTTFKIKTSKYCDDGNLLNNKAKANPIMVLFSRKEF